MFPVQYYPKEQTVFFDSRVSQVVLLEDFAVVKLIQIVMFLREIIRAKNDKIFSML